MVGNGINDSLVLASGDISIALEGEGKDAAGTHTQWESALLVVLNAGSRLKRNCRAWWRVQ